MARKPASVYLPRHSLLPLLTFGTHVKTSRCPTGGQKAAKCAKHALFKFETTLEAPQARYGLGSEEAGNTANKYIRVREERKQELCLTPLKFQLITR